MHLINLLLSLRVVKVRKHQFYPSAGLYWVHLQLILVLYQDLLIEVDLLLPLLYFDPKVIDICQAVNSLQKDIDQSQEHFLWQDESMLSRVLKE